MTINTFVRCCLMPFPHLVEGSLIWQQEGLGSSGTVEAATEEYRVQMNAIQSCLDEETVEDSNRPYTDGASSPEVH